MPSNNPGIEIKVTKGEAEVIKLSASKEFSSEHTLHLDIYGIKLDKGCELINPKFIPFIVLMQEINRSRRLVDFYSFDNNGFCLCHSYSRFENGKKIEGGRHDNDISRLKENGKAIEEMIGDYDIPQSLLNMTVAELRTNSLRQR